MALLREDVPGDLRCYLAWHYLRMFFWFSCCCARQQQIPGESTGFAKRRMAASTNSLWNPPSDWCFWSETKSPHTICVQDFPKPSSHVRHDPDALHLEAVPVDHRQDFCGKGSTTLQSQSLPTMT